MKKHEWFRERKYLHFDYPVAEKDKYKIIKYVSNPKLVAKHSFYPFISYLATKYKIRTDAETTKRYLDDTGTRPISYAAHLDAQIYSYYSEILSEKYESTLRHLGLTDTVIAFRKLKDLQTGDSKSNIHLARDAFDAIKTFDSCTVYAFDVKGFFDNLNSVVLKQKWEKTLGVHRLPDDHYSVYKSVTKFSVIMRDDLYAMFKIPSNYREKGVHRICNPKDFRLLVRGNSKAVDNSGFEKRGLITIKGLGIPQGSPISAILANIYMLDFDSQLNAKVKKLGGKYFRYCDDILCIVPTKNNFDCAQYVSASLKEICLDINPGKTDISNFTFINGSLTCDKPIQYLGFNFDGKHSYIRTSSISRYIRKAKKAILLAKAARIKQNTIRAKNGESPEPLYKKKLFERYYHNGKSNFMTYGYRASEVLKSPQIRNQMKKMQNFLLREIAS